MINEIVPGKVYKIKDEYSLRYEYFFILNVNKAKNVIQYYNLKTPRITSTAVYNMSCEFLEDV